jgi:hypothetical protein
MVSQHVTMMYVSPSFFFFGQKMDKIYIKKPQGRYQSPVNKIGCYQNAPLYALHEVNGG